jgi:S1-C subfamily serine protease
MKTCPTCHQLLGEQVLACPSCGHEIDAGLKTLDGYCIEQVLKDGYGSMLCKAVLQETGQPYTLCIYKPQAHISQEIVERLKTELKKLEQLPRNAFVAHYAINQAADGTCYRVSEWIDAVHWGNLLASGKLDNFAVLVDIFYQIAKNIETLHQMGHFLPHLTLDDIMVFEGRGKALRVKVDYQLARFLTPQLARPGITLQKLLATHPDIQKKRALDPRSDIWSLGKLFVELLSKDPGRIDYHAQINELILPHELERLLRLMLSDDPGQRPQSMTEVVAVLERVKKRRLLRRVERQRGKLISRMELADLRQRITVLATCILIVTILGAVSVYYLFQKKDDSASHLSDIAKRYAPSVAFVLSEYGLSDGDNLFYHQRAEGTAFLVDPQGYLLTNRHVACPWLEDNEMFALIGQLQQLGISVKLDHRVYLWFEGSKAFKRLPGLSASTDIEDVYNIATAYSTDTQPRLTIVGVGRAPTKTYQQIRSPLKDDFAVLKIDTVPRDLVSLPLDPQAGQYKIARLAPIITLGFPLGSTAQETTVNVSVTGGHVRRNFENVMQVDTSIYKGNSGGPIIDQNGQVVGIASRVAVDLTEGKEQAATMLSDIGMVLPIANAAKFIGELKAGQPKWNGILDLAEDAKIATIVQLARARNWEQASTRADEALTDSSSPAVLMAAAMIHYCAQNYSQSQKLLERSLSIDESNATARMVLYLIDWQKDKMRSDGQGKVLRALDWRSSWELYGHLVGVLEGHVTTTQALQGGYNNDERAWLTYVVGLMRAKQGHWDKAEALLQQAVLKSDSDGWLFYMILSHLEYIQQRKMNLIKRSGDKNVYRRGIKAFNHDIENKITEDQAMAVAQAGLDVSVSSAGMPLAVRRVMYERLLTKEPANGDMIHDLAFYSAMEEDWVASLSYIGQFLAIPGRENAHRLSLGLWEPMILQHIGQEREARKKLETFVAQTRAPWFKAIGNFLLGQSTETALAERAGENPDYLLTAYAALGFWAEGLGEKKKALNYYREALGTYMDEWRLYDFVWERIKKIRKEL